ncbi:hypothetical protein KAT08_00950 [Candidatus Babeliales bacterium]|nr:hypothetical protein [Candidatus Babeliales bacterium]
MLDNYQYNTIKLLHELSSICWFLKKHGIPDSKNSRDDTCAKILDDIKNDLDKHIKVLDEMVK